MIGFSMNNDKDKEIPAKKPEIEITSPKPSVISSPEPDRVESRPEPEIIQSPIESPTSDISEISSSEIQEL